MKKLLLLLVTVLVSLSSWAAKADSQPFTLRQSDGTLITVVLHGDEDMNWYTTTDGILLKRVGRDFHIARVNSKAELESTGILAHNPTQRQAKELTAIKQQNREAFFTQLPQLQNRQRVRRIALGSDVTYFPHSGTPKALVILVNFADSTFSTPDPKKSFDQYLNSDAEPGTLQNLGTDEHRNYASVSRYFSDMSFGKFQPHYDIVGPVTLSQPLAYYGADKGSTTDVNYRAMITEACTLVDDSVDFSQYDANNDGKVDLVYIVYAGYAQSIAGNSSDCIWPKSGAANLGTFDGKQVYRFGVNNELNGRPTSSSKKIVGIGLFCHEFSHTLGLPDLYPTVSSAQIDNQAMEYWDLMDGGEYVNSGRCPTPYTPWEREVLGWMQTDTLSDTTQVVLTPIQQQGKAYKILADTAGEYLLVENIQKHGWYQKLPSQGGLIVYRIDYPRAAVNLHDNPNNTAGKPAITIVPADSLLITSYNVGSGKPYTSQQYLASMDNDLYPGPLGVTQLLEVQLNNSLLQKPLYNIAMSDSGTVSFDFLKDFSQTAILLPGVKNKVSQAVYSLDGTFVGTSLEGLRPGIYIRNHKKVIITK